MSDTGWTEVLGGLLGGGTIGTIVARWLKSRTANRRIEARLVELENEREDRVREAALRLATQATSEAREAREETGQHRTEYTNLVRAYGKLEAENAELRGRVAALEERVRLLQEQIEQLLSGAARDHTLVPDVRPGRVIPIREKP